MGPMTRRRRSKVGGARPGAGRKPAAGVARSVARKVYLTPDEAVRHDAARGEQPYTDFAREAIEQRIAATDTAALRRAK